MTSPESGVPDIERGLLGLFRRELRRAVDNVVGPPDEHIDSIRTQKLVLSGIRRFELEEYVTIQWYLDGDMLPNLPDEDDDVEIITNAGVENGPFPTPDEVYDFYTDDLSESITTGETLSEVLEQDAFEWLQKYYQAREVPFSDVYQVNLEIYLRLRHLQEYLDPDDPRDELLDEMTMATSANTISDAAARLKQNLLEYPLFQSIPTYVTEFDRIAKQVLTQISEDIETADDPGDYHVLVSHLGRFYYKAIWQPIADRIGYYTVSAPTEDKAEEVRNFRTENLQSARSTFLRELNYFRDQSEEFDLQFEVRTERLPNFSPEQSGLEEVLSVDLVAAEES